MPRIVHLSDLHFGRDRPELLTPLVHAVNALAADLVVVSGDLTQRARRRQFSQAVALLDRIAAPKLVVPGNHDVPFWNVAFRLLRPYDRFRRYFGENIEPTVRLDGVAVIGVNSVDPQVTQRGRMDPDRIDRAVARLQDFDPGMLKIVALHHPLVHPEASDKEPMDGAAEAATALSRAGADIVLSGHLHNWGAAVFPVTDAGAMLYVQAGTGLSTRVRGEPNDFNLIDCAPVEVAVTRLTAGDAAAGFLRQPVQVFRKGDAGWANISA